MSIKVLSWNLGEWNTNEVVDTIIKEKPDIMVFTEFEVKTPKSSDPNKKKKPPKNLEVPLTDLGYSVNFQDQKVCICYKPINNIVQYNTIPISDRIACLEFIQSSSKETNSIYFFGIHLIDKWYRSEFDQFVDAQNHANKIFDYCFSNNIYDFVILGDFNLNPWEQALTNVSSFNATHAFKATGNIIEKGFRKGFENRQKLCNTTWLLISDGIRNEESKNGTYHFNAPNWSEIDWNFIDQVLLSESLINKFEIESNTTKAFRICAVEATENKPKCHFPVSFTLNIN